ncbi:hypothetical protein HF086_007488 [Spodoptera exigua]|uniref:Lipase domain-containing protein n=1 Tax=Spodoptera exigua TaxID=7107 RepID=A0A922M2Z9_SPOEX|nr:hypothetical protein HF086_007488 [Spodoptera exigua]
MYNKTSATLMLQTIMVLMDKQNSTDVTNFPSTFNDDAELERCYGTYGCFSKAYPWTEHRPDNFFPVPPEAMAVRYPAFTRRNRKIPVLFEADNKEKIANANLDPRGPFYFISHGFLEGGHKPWIQNMADALLNLEGNEGATVIVVDWRGGSQPPYGQAVANIRLIGVMTAHLIHNIYEVLGLQHIDNFHFIGHSLGAHLGGYCGHALQKRFYLKLGRITGLDPASPYFARTVTLVRLDRSDAKYVDIIHSNALPLYFSGCKQSSSSSGGSGDLSYQQIAKFVGCDHERSYEYFIESVAPTCPFMAVQCESYDLATVPAATTIITAYQWGTTRMASTSGCRRAALLTPTLTLHCMLSRAIVNLFAVILKVANTTASITHGPESGKLSITLVDRNNNKSDHMFLEDEQKFYKPGVIEKKMVAVKDTGHPPVFVIVEWKYETNLFNPMTWRLLKSPSIYVEYMKLSSIEYNTEITVCPKRNKPVVANLPTIMKPKYCKFSK